MNDTTEALDLEKILPWSKSKRIDTKNGPRDVSKCLLKRGEDYTERFWSLWRNPDTKKQIVIAGVSVSKEWGVDNGEWEATFWRLPSKEELQRLETSMEASVAIDAAPDVIIPCPPGCQLLPFQRGGVAYALQRAGTLLGDDMGCGKTCQAIGFINAKPDIDLVIVVCPASVRINWLRELQKWLVFPSHIRIGEPDPNLATDFFKRANGAQSFNAEIRKNSAKNLHNVTALLNNPSVLVGNHLDIGAALPDVLQHSGGTLVSESAKSRKPVDEGLVRVVNSNSPPRSIGQPADGPLTVNDASQVGSLSSTPGHDNGLGAPLLSKQVSKPAQLELVAKSTDTQAQLLGGLVAAQPTPDEGQSAIEHWRRDCRPTHIFIVNYDVLHRYDVVLEGVKPDLVIMDEAQYLKNEKTKRGQAALRLGKSATYRLALTGTPMENDEAEVFTIAKFCDPVEYNNRFMFRRKYTGTTENRKRLQRKLRSTIMVRRLKSEVLKDMPPKFRSVIEVPYEDEELKEFERQATRKMPAERMEELKAALELAKASDNFADYEAAVQALKVGCSTAFEMMAELRHRTAQAALPYCIDHLRNVFDSGVQKVIFFSHHRDINDAIVEAFPGSVQHYGGMSDADKQQSVDKFQMDPHCPLFSGSIRASGVGLTLTAASRVVFGELDWVPGRMTQAEDRAHRIGQKDNVNVDVLVLEGSFFATMAKRIVEKQVAIDQALDEDRTRLAAEPIVVIPTYTPKAPKPITASRAEMIERSATMDPSTIAAVHECLKRLAGVCDGALALDDVGFNGCDTRIGHSLAGQARLSPLQAVLGQKLVRKYRRQLGDQLLEAALRGSKTKDDNE